MYFRKYHFALAAMSLLAAAPVFAQATTVHDRNTADVQRDVNQQDRIEQGLKSGQLDSREAGKLEKQEAHVDRMEKRDDRNGSISPAEQARLKAAQNHVSKDIAHDKHNAATGNPDSRSSRRLQADVQRNANQQQRIENGLKSGSLNNREAGKLERGQAHVDRTEVRASHGGVNAREQARIQRKENHQSARIHNKRHNLRRHG